MEGNLQLQDSKLSKGYGWWQASILSLQSFTKIRLKMTEETRKQGFPNHTSMEDFCWCGNHSLVRST